jgi:hypothetical protein
MTEGLDQELLAGCAVGLAEGQGPYTAEEAFAVYRDLEAEGDSERATLVRERRIKIVIGDGGDINYSTPDAGGGPLRPIETSQ